jgi:hypothetical protein
MKPIYIIIDNLVTVPDAWETHFASLLQGYIEAKQMTDYEIVEVCELSIIKQKFENKEIENGTKFIFPNAWTSATTYIKHWSELNNVQIETIGLWSRGCFINEDEEFRPLGNRDWRKVFERASFRCLDKSFFISEYHKEQFRIYVSKFVFPDRLGIMPFPLDYLELEMALYKDKFYKQDMIIFPWVKYTQLQEQIMYDFIRVYSNMQIIFAQEKSPLERSQLLTQVSKAKVAFLPYSYPNIGKEIYECLLLGTIPLVPDLEAFRDLVPEEFRYPPEWTQSIFNYSRYAPDLTSKIKELTSNYSSYVPLIRTQVDYLFEKYYDSEKIIEQIFGNSN